MGILSSILKALPGRRMAPNLIPVPLAVTVRTTNCTQDEGEAERSRASTGDNEVEHAHRKAQPPAGVLTVLSVGDKDFGLASVTSSPTSSTSSSSSSSCSSMTLTSPTLTTIDENPKNRHVPNIVIDDADDRNFMNSATSTILTDAGNATLVSDTTTPLTKSPMARPSKRRQESDLTADIEATVMGLDIDKDTSRAENTDDDVCALMTLGNKDPCEKNSGPITTISYPLVQNRMFDIPEIIRSIAEFLDKPSLAASCRISRIWATHCTPLLWKHVVDKHWRDTRFYASFRSQAHFIRTMKCEDKTDCEEMLLCELPRLKAISFHGSRESMVVKEKVLHKVYRTLTSLVLSSVANSLSLETVLAVRSLRQLRTLKLLNVNIQRQQLAEILRDCENLEFLSLSKVQLMIGGVVGGMGGLEDEDEDEDVVVGSTALGGFGSHSHNVSISDGSSNYHRASQVDEQTVPTKIRYLALKEITVPTSYLTRMIRSCPELLELSLARNENMTFTTNLIRTMRASCPRLYAIDVGSCKQIDHETFSELFKLITQLTVINLSGTRVADEDLLLLAENCRNVTRLDIQYCTSVTSNGLHQFMSHAGPSLRHLEASGVTIEPESFAGHRHWTCTNLQILFVHVGLVGSVAPSRMSISAGRLNSEKTTTQSSPGMVVDSAGNEKKRSQDAVSCSSTYPGGSSSSGTSPHPVTTQDASTDGATGSSGEADTSSLTSTKTGTGSKADVPTESYTEADADGDVVMKHPLHPIQEVFNVQYLGLMGCGPKLTSSMPSQLIHGFRSVKRLHVLGLYQAFRREDLEWLVESLPELCRIDAEKYNVSDELLKLFEETYPHVQICRQE